MELAVAALGLIIGSFLNVLILRTGTDEGVGGRSHCPKCRHQLAWYDLIPVVSWVALSGRCRYCRARISIQYPMVEAGTAVLFYTFASSWLPVLPLIMTLGIMALYVAITVFDLHHSLIPDEWNYAAAMLALVYGYVLYGNESPFLFILAGPVAALPLFLLWAYSRGAWMGFGDVKLALSFGWILGPLHGFVAVMFAFVIGAVVSLAILLPLSSILTFAHRQGWISLSGAGASFTMQSEVPFGPFLIASCIILWLSLLYGVPIPLVP